MDSEYVVVGQVLRPHGVRGEVAVRVESDVPGRFEVGAKLTATVGTARREVEIASLRLHHGRLLVRFLDVEDRDEAALLRGSLLEVPADQVPPAEADSYYFFELVGCRCEDRTAGPLGTVKDVLEDGGGILLEVVAEGRSCLVPFVRSFLLRVDLEGRRIELDLPPGLIETCGSPS